MTTQVNKIIYFSKRGNAQQPTNIYLSKSSSAYPNWQNHILFLHALTGFDIESAIFRSGKAAIFKLFDKKN